MSQIEMKVEVRQHGRQGHRNAGSALSKYKLCVFGRSGVVKEDEPFGEIYIPIKMIGEKGYPDSIVLNFKKGGGE